MQTIITRGIPQTNSNAKPARLTARVSRGPQRITMSWPMGAHSDEHAHALAVQRLLAKLGTSWPTERLIGGALDKRSMVWVLDHPNSPHVRGTDLTGMGIPL